MTQRAVWSRERAYRLDNTPYVRLTLRSYPQHEILWGFPLPLLPQEVEELLGLLAELRAAGWAVDDLPAATQTR